MMSPDVDTAAKNYLELSNQAYDVLVDAFSTRSTRTLDNAKLVYEILSRPSPQPFTVDGVVRDNFDRAQQIVSLTVKELLTTGRRATKVTGSLVETGAKVQEAWLNYVRAIMGTGLSSAGLATPAVDSVKRVVEKPRETAATTSSN